MNELSSKHAASSRSLPLQDVRAMCRTYGPGLAVMFVALLILSAAVGMQRDLRARVFLAGEIASVDVMAERNIQVEDPIATQARREQLARMQPTAFDLSGAEAARLRQRLFDVFHVINDDEVSPPLSEQPTPSKEAAGDMPPDAEPGQTPLPLSTAEVMAGERADVPQRLYELTGINFAPDAIRTLAETRVQSYMTEVGLPWLEARLLEGVISDVRSMHASATGMLIRNMDTGAETLRPPGSDMRDVSSLLASFSQQMRTDSGLNVTDRRALNTLISALIMPTLTINREATQTLGLIAGQNVDPVYYRINKGEVIVNRGERVSREQQLKLQTLFRSGKTFLRAPETFGTLIIALVISLGLFVAPSAKPSSPMRRRDLCFIAFLLLLFGISAKGLYMLAPGMLDGPAVAALPYAFPVTAASGLAALIFASRRYCVTGLLVSFFCTLLFGGSVGLFLFYFLSAMCNTWLVMRAQNRQDVVRSIMPLGCCLFPLGVAAAMLEGFPAVELPTLFVCLLISLLLTQFMMFTISPILELAFGYTTRFRLMELTNLEQPLLQDLMVSAPGTYHHSLVVSNMVEAGAKAVGANGLLCKVAALYHDIGKLAYPDYFIENQFGGPNRHDKLAPAMSALILVSHVKKGVELAQKHRLGYDIVDLICQHHGTSIMRFFFKKAQEQSQGEPVRAEDFQYPGPRPQTREAAIVMVADMVEASSRTLSDPTPARIRTHIDTIIKNIYADGQLDESAITFQDLHKLSESFARILTGLFHQRIAYPDLHRRQDATRQDQGTGAENAQEAAGEDTQLPEQIGSGAPSGGLGEDR